jgi:hypothetical protein
MICATKVEFTYAYGMLPFYFLYDLEFYYFLTNIKGICKVLKKVTRTLCLAKIWGAI